MNPSLSKYKILGTGKRASGYMRVKYMSSAKNPSLQTLLTSSYRAPGKKFSTSFTYGAARNHSGEPFGSTHTTVSYAVNDKCPQELFYHVLESLW
jgi:hypothetical protein